GGAADDADVPGNLTIAELSGADIVGIKTNATGCGTVTVSNVSAEFTGKVVTGSGTTVMDSLAWVDDATRLVLGPGTLTYTGTGETVPGLTLNAGASKQAILDVANDLTLEAVLIGTSAFSKTGPGDLVLKGPGAFNLGNTNKGKSQMLGIGLYGDSPVDTFQHVTVADGRLIIGEEGGTEAEPYIVLSGGEMDIGGCTASAVNGRQETAGEFVMNSGTFICNYVEPSYYNGSNGTYPEGGTQAKITVNGGFLKTGTLQIGYDNMQTHVLSTLVTMTGGTFEIGTLNFQSVPGNPACPPSTTWNQSGGVTTCTAFNGGATAIGGSSIKNNGAWGPGRMTLTNCTFAVYGTMALKNGTDTEINVLADAVFEAGSINGSGSASSVIRFDGGTWRPYVASTGNTETKSLTHLYLARRTVIDTSDDRGLGLPQRYWHYLNQKVEADPESAEEDIGLTIRGGGTVAVGTAFNKNTLTGPVRVTDRSTILPLTTALGNSTVEVEPGSSLRQYNDYATVSNLTLGAVGATELVLLDLNQEKDKAKTQNNIIVTGELNVLSPVAFRTHPITTYQAFDMEVGTFTGLVFRAGIDLDLTKFTVPNHPLAKSVTYSVVTVPSGTYKDWKALVVKIAATAAGTPRTYDASGRVWTATSGGGGWDVSSNWNGNEPPAGADEQANFLPAAAANVPVALDGLTTVGGISLAGGSSANGYAFSGGFLKIATALTGRSLPFAADSGAHTFNVPVSFGARAMIDTSEGASIDFAGGVSANSSVIVVNRGHATGGGEVRIHNPVGVSILASGCGRTIVDNLDFMTASNHLEISRGTLRYTGPSTTIPGFRLVSGGGYAGILDIPAGTTLGVKSITASSTGFIKVGAGDLKLTGNGNFTLGDSSHDNTGWANTYMGENGDAPRATHRKGNVSQGRIIQGTVGDPNDAPNVYCDNFNLGLDTVPGEDCAYVMNNGVLTLNAHYNDYYHGSTKLGNTLFEVNGGVVTSGWVRTVQTADQAVFVNPRLVMNGGYWHVKTSLVMGHQRIRKANYRSTLEVNGGRLDVLGALNLVNSAQTSTNTTYKTTDGYVYVNGGILDVGGLCDLCLNANNMGTIWMNGGVFGVDGVTLTRGKGYLYFNGGTFAPYGAAAANRTLTGLTAAYVSTNGAVISTANAGDGAYEIAQPLLHDPALTGADGGLVKTGAGLLTLSGANTYTGPTAVEGGTLRIAGSVASDELILRKDGIIDLGGGTVTFATVTSLDGNLSPQTVNGTLHVGERLTVGATEGAYGTVFATTNLTLAAGATLALTADDAGTAGDLLLVEGNLACEGALTVDFGRTAEDPLAYGMKIPLAEVTGAVTVPEKMTAANAGLDPVTLGVSVEGGVLYATVKSGGTALIFR
ncbi:MAG: autotransporter-associated beta strand repeat-containing protein, partial [Kiritimatiellae bacterium]|nr:autotransporter-associated beta strand repeat-containing protein [Kiritimatiellia bacterium]